MSKDYVSSDELSVPVNLKTQEWLHIIYPHMAFHNMLNTTKGMAKLTANADVTKRVLSADMDEELEFDLGVDEAQAVVNAGAFASKVVVMLNDWARVLEELDGDERHVKDLREAAKRMALDLCQSSPKLSLLNGALQALRDAAKERADE